MTIVAPEQQIASAFFVLHGHYGDVTRYAQQRGVCRQAIYREGAALRQALAGARQERDQLRDQLRQAPARQAELEARLAQAVVLDAHKRAEVACVAQARGVTLRDGRELLRVLIPKHTLSVAELGRRTHAAGQKAGELLKVLDEVWDATAELLMGSGIARTGLRWQVGGRLANDSEVLGGAGDGAGVRGSFRGRCRRATGDGA